MLRGLALVKPVYAWAVNNPAGGVGSLGDLVGGKIFPVAVQLGAIMAFFYAIWGGLRYIMAEGDPKKVDGAKGMLTNAIIGFVLLFSAFAIIKILDAVLGTSFGG